MTLATENLALERGGRRVLGGVSTSLETGQITAIVGPNGAGKSSLLLALAGLLQPVEGMVSLNGEALATMHPRERSKAIGYLPQSAEIAWDVAVENLVALGRMPHRDRGREAVEAAIANCTLQELRHRPSSTLSGGERARALLARVLAGEPRWILADEPLAALDLAHQLSLIAQLRARSAKGLGVVIVLHDLTLAMNHADRVLVLDQGKLAADGAPGEALASNVIAATWQVQAEWIGEAGQRALVSRTTP